MSDCKPCQTKKCKPNQCGCAVLISSDCVNDVKSVFTNLDIPTGLPLTQTLELIDEAFGLGNLVNVGTGVGVFKGTALNGDKQLKSLKSTDNSVTITANEANTEIDLSVDIPTPTEVCITSNDDSVTITENEGCFDLSVSVEPTDVCITSEDDSVTITEKDGCFDLSTKEYSIEEGDNVNITGTGTLVDPWVISSEISLNSGATTNVSGAGTTASPYVVEVANLQKTIVVDEFPPYVLQASDDKYTIFVENEGSDAPSESAIVQIPNTLPANFTVVFINEVPEGAGDVSIIFQPVTGGTANIIVPNGYEPMITGNAKWVCLEKKLGTQDYYLVGNLTPTP